MYSAVDEQYYFDGRVDTKLTVLTDPKQMKDHMKNMVGQGVRKTAGNGAAKRLRTEPPKPSASAPMSPLNLNPYGVENDDAKGMILNKFLSLVALGPVTRESIRERTHLSDEKLQPLITTYAQVYNPNDNFISDDSFPNDEIQIEGIDYFTLKDKSYKDLRPWQWSWYSERERLMIINNAHNALTRLGYLETHPLRKKICDEPAEDQDSEQKKPSLGGGILISKTKKSPFKRAHTDSPKPLSEGFNARPAEKTKSNGSPLKPTLKRKLSTSSTSEDERGLKKKKQDSDSHTSPSSSINDDDYGTESLNEGNPSLKNRSSTAESDDDQLNHKQRRFQYYTSLAEKFRSKYKEYESLYKSLKLNPNNSSNDKKKLQKLFELHNNLSEWKRKLWDFDNENKSKVNIMNLSKHKKQPSKSLNSTPVIVQDVTPRAPVHSESNNQRRNGPVRMNTVPKLSLDY